MAADTSLTSILVSDSSPSQVCVPLSSAASFQTFKRNDRVSVLQTKKKQEAVNKGLNMLFSVYNYIYRQHSHHHHQCVSEQLVRIYDQLLVSIVLISPLLLLLVIILSATVKLMCISVQAAGLSSPRISLAVPVHKSPVRR